MFTSIAAQAAYCKEHGEAALVSLLASEGLKIGHVKAAAPVDPAAKFKGAGNPYSDQFKGTPAQRHAAIEKLILNKDGHKLAASLSKAAGKTLDGLPLRPVGTARMQQ